MRKVVLGGIFVLGLAVGAGAALLAPSLALHAPYAGQDERAISSLSGDDIEQLREGRGWGLAKPAELNGYPGPLHIIELSDDLALSSGQCEAIRSSFDAMRQRARELGNDLIAAERALDEAFERGRLDATELRRLLAEAERVRAALRGVHLAAHLEVTPLLSREQRELYATLRGYGAHGGH